ncbi:MAG: hypothetical protein P8Y03_24790 [Anaerolineales bacterium]|jgi:hypothetical protein
MAEIDLFIAMAEIAGVFVGFGALISVTQHSEIEAGQLGQIRAVVTIGLVVMVAALIPIGLDRYHLSSHNLWFVSSLVFLVISWAVIVLSLRRPENRQLMIAQARSSPMKAMFFWLLLELPVQIPLLLILLGPWPDLEPAFYLTTLVFNLFEAAFVLAQLVYSQVSP